MTATSQISCKRYRLLPSYRLVILALSFVSSSFWQFALSNMGFAAICMLNTTDSGSSSSKVNTKCSAPLVNRSAVQPNHNNGGELRWSEAELSSVLAAITLGAIWSATPIGYFLDRCGNRVVVAVGAAFLGVGTLLTPLVAEINVWLLMAMRVVIGLMAVVHFTCIGTLSACWAADGELGTFISLSSIGTSFGGFFGMVTSGVLCESRFGWKSIFYIQGIIMVVWLAAWCFLYRDEPSLCKLISPEETAFVTSTRKKQTLSATTAPWKHILTSKHIWANIALQLSVAWQTLFFFDYLPIFLQQEIGFSTQTDGTVSSLPFVTAMVVRIFCGFISDRLERHIAAFSLLRVFAFFTTVVPGLCYLALSFLDCRHKMLAAVLMCVILAGTGTSTVSFQKAYVLMAPDNAGLVGSIGQALAMVVGVIVSYLGGDLIDHGSWRVALLTNTGISVVGFVIFNLFGSGEEENWSQMERNKTKAEKQFTRF